MRQDTSPDIAIFEPTDATSWLAYRKLSPAQSRSVGRRPKQPHSGTRVDNYRCSLPGLAGFTIYRCGGTVRTATKWRRGRDSNPRYASVYTLSRRAPSTARTPLPARARMIPQQLQDTSRRNGQFRAIIHRGLPGVIPVRNLLLVLATLAGRGSRYQRKALCVWSDWWRIFLWVLKTPISC